MGLENRVRGSDRHREQERGVAYISGVELHKYHQRPALKVIVFIPSRLLMDRIMWQVSEGVKYNFFKFTLYVIRQALLEERQQ